MPSPNPMDPRETEARERERKAYYAGFMERHSGSLCGGELEAVQAHARSYARSAYPDTVTLSNSCVYKIESDVIMVRDGQRWVRSDMYICNLTPSDLRKLNSLLDLSHG